MSKLLPDWPSVIVTPVGFCGEANMTSWVRGDSRAADASRPMRQPSPNRDCTVTTGAPRPRSASNADGKQGPPDQDLAVAAQQADEEQRPGRAGSDQHLVMADTKPGGQQGTQRRVAGGGAIAEVHLGQAGQAVGAEQAGNCQIAGHALTKVVPRFPVDQGGDRAGRELSH